MSKIRVCLADLMIYGSFYYFTLAEHLRNQPGFDIDFAFDRLRYLDDHRDALRAPWVRVSRLNTAAVPAPVRTMGRAGNYIINLVKLAYIAPRRYDLVHFQWFPLLGQSEIEPRVLKYLQLHGLRCVYTAHNTVPHNSGDRYKQAYRAMYQLPQMIITHGETARQRLIDEMQVRSERICIIRHGLLQTAKPVEYNQARAQLGISPDTVMLLALGLMRPYKGFDILAQAWSQAVSDIDDAVMYLVGYATSKEQEQVHCQLREDALRKTRETYRYVSEDEAAQLHSAADVLVYPYRAIDNSGALLTGVVHRKAIVASELDGFKEILKHNENALLVAPGDVAALANALRTVVTDLKLRLRLQQGLVNTDLHEYDWNVIADNTCHLYHRLMNT